jgi:hypothetical protein
MHVKAILLLPSKTAAVKRDPLLEQTLPVEHAKFAGSPLQVPDFLELPDHPGNGSRTELKLPRELTNPDLLRRPGQKESQDERTSIRKDA